MEPEVLERCLEIALQAPTGSNGQGWHFVVVTNAQARARLATVYRRGFEDPAGVYTEGSLPCPPGDLRSRQFQRMVESSAHLMEHLHEVLGPTLVNSLVLGLGYAPS